MSNQSHTNARKLLERIILNMLQPFNEPLQFLMLQQFCCRQHSTIHQPIRMIQEICEASEPEQKVTAT